jgi:uncharacterized protein (DUF697 family)
VNQSLLLHVVERLEGLVGKLPAAIQKPILSELTPMKELFLRQRPPRFLFAGSNKAPVTEIVSLLFPEAHGNQAGKISTIHRWHDLKIVDRGTISILDARTLGGLPGEELPDELQRQPADVVFFVDDADGPKTRRKTSFDNLIQCLEANDKGRADTKVIAIFTSSAKSNSARDGQKTEVNITEPKVYLAESLASRGLSAERLAGSFLLPAPPKPGRDAKAVMSAIAGELPNEARIEMGRLSRDRDVQGEIAQILVKSTTAICTAIGAQPIPLADLPILTTLQLVMVSGILYISGRERSLRAATEFVGALGANVGAGMLLREGTRAVLKFFPGWGNLICGMVAGAGTYAIGRAAIAFFIDGVSIKDARRTYLRNRKKSAQPRLMSEEQPAKAKGRRK